MGPTGVLLSVLLTVGCASSPAARRSFQDLEYGYATERKIVSRRARATIHVAEIGRASTSSVPLVLIHAWGTNMLVWREISGPLARHRTVLLVDLPGHGKSSKPPGPYPPRRLAGAVVDLLDAAHVDRAILIGNSLGGATALEVALVAPERVAALVLVGAPGGARIPPLFETGARDLVTATNVRTLSDEAWHLGWTVIARGSTPLTRRMSEDAVSLKSSPEWPAFSRAMSSSLREVARWQPPVERISAPALVVQGARDIVVFPSSGRALAERLPRGELALLESCGHMPEMECPEEFLARVVPFLAAQP